MSKKSNVIPGQLRVNIWEKPGKFNVLYFIIASEIPQDTITYQKFRTRERHGNKAIVESDTFCFVYRIPAYVDCDNLCSIPYNWIQQYSKVIK